MSSSTILFCMSGWMWTAALAHTPGPRDWHYHFYKEPQPLVLDRTRVMVYIDAPAAQLHDVTRYGRVTPWPLPGWYVIGLPNAFDDEAAVVDLVDRLSRDERLRFVSPMFLSSADDLIVITPWILVGVQPTLPSETRDALFDVGQSVVAVEPAYGAMPGVSRLTCRSRNGFDVLAAANTLARDADILFAEPDALFTGRAHFEPNDPGYQNGLLWGIHDAFGDFDVDGPEAWDVSQGDPSVRVLIIDVGVEQDHPDINQIPGVDLTNDPDAPGDGGPAASVEVHGTAVAGCVSARINNGLGSVGVAPQCPSASARTFIGIDQFSWTSFASWTVDALAWAESNDVRVTNNSNGYGFQSSAIAQKYSQTRRDGMVHFASSGNFGAAVIDYPASLPSVNAVGGVQSNGSAWPQSNYGDAQAFVAPAVEVYTTDVTGNGGYGSGDYVFAFGTSFASPYAASVAALIVSADPDRSALQVEQNMINTAVDLGPDGFDPRHGYGYVNALAALKAIPGACHGAILNAAPLPGAVDARQPHDINDAGDVDGWSAVTLIVGGASAFVEASDYVVSHEGSKAPPPEIKSAVELTPGFVRVTLVPPMAPGTWTTIAHKCSGSSARFGYLPGDVNGDAVTGPVDIIALIDILNGVDDAEDYSTDINRSEQTEPTDILLLIDLLNGAGAFAVWNGRALPK